MARNLGLAFSAAMVILLVTGAPLMAQQMGAPTAPGGTAGQMAPEEQTMMQQDQQGMKQMGADSDMMMRRKMLMGMQVSPTDPGAVMSLKEELNLTDEQVQKLQSIAQDARQQAEAVLQPEQKQKLSDLKSTPQSMMSMCKHMKEKGMTSPTPGAEPMGGATRPGMEPPRPGATGTQPSPPPAQ